MTDEEEHRDLDAFDEIHDLYGPALYEAPGLTLDDIYGDVGTDP